MLTNNDLDSIVKNFIFNYGLSPHHIESMNIFCKSGLSEILQYTFNVEKMVHISGEMSGYDGKIALVGFKVAFSNVNLQRPTMGGKTVLMPAEARKKDKSYMGWLTADITITATAYFRDGGSEKKEEKLENFAISEIPVMVGSMLCNTYGMTKEALLMCGEDPSDPQGIFIINGNEWIINNLVSRKYNIWYVFHNEHGTEHARAEFISMPGDSFENSTEIKIIYYNTGEISFILTSDRYFKEIEIPFYIVLKLFGLTTEKSIVETIVPVVENGREVDVKMREILQRAFLVKYKHMPKETRFMNDHAQIMETLIHEMAVKYIDTKGATSLEEKNKNILVEKKILKEVLMNNFDIYVLPHQGKTAEKRFSKALYLCIGLRKMLECYFDVLPSTNRESNEVKRVLPSGDNFSRMFKKEFNKSFVNTIKPMFDQAAQNNGFNNLDLSSIVKLACKQSSFKARIKSNINTGMSETVVNGETRKNRMPSEGLKRKNHANVINGTTIQRSSHTAQVQSNHAAIVKRDVKSGSVNNTCVFQSAEGANAGLMQNTCMGVIISMSSSTEIMVKVIEEEPGFIPYDKVFGINNEYTKIYVNGRWIGYVENPFEFYEIFVFRRRGWDWRSGKRMGQDIMERKMTICWNNDQREMDFRTDRGRSLTPFVVVYDNISPIGQKLLGSKCDPLTGKGFKQQILFTKQHAKDLALNKIKIDDLFNEGIIDYIAPEELKQIICSETIENLKNNEENFYNIYTHLMIPATLTSVTTALTPFIHHCPPTRVAFATNHLRQACGPTNINFMQRFDKQAYYQPIVEMPIAYTIANLIVAPMGKNIVEMVLPIDGRCMEDSVVGNKAAYERGQYYLSKFTFYKKALEREEEFGIPDHFSTEGIDNRADYSKLNDKGHVPMGATIKKGDVLIGCLLKYNAIKLNDIIYKDMSVIYEDDETAYVAGIEFGIDSEMNKFIKIRLEIPRQMGLGQKMSSRNGQKGMIAATYCQSDMPFLSNGLVPSLILSPCAFPSRLTVNQIVEMLASKLGIMEGACVDVSFMATIDNQELYKKLMAKGVDRFGLEVVYNGRTGVAMNRNLFTAPVFQGRLQKFSEEELYAVGNDGAKCNVTRQPASGRKNGGGIRLGEMEKDCLNSSGLSIMASNKMKAHCDGISIYICRNCRNRATVINDENKTAICNICGSDARVFEFPTRFGSHLVLTLFESLGCRIKYIPRPLNIIY
jgi:DNA-directed RNA polymerase beta subunit